MEALMIGVSGMRGTIGGTLTPLVVTRMGCAFAAWLKQNQPPANGTHYRVAFGRDTRPSGPWVRDAAAGALGASGVEVIDLDVVTTPGVAMMVKHTGADGGLIATASHNPIQWNGLKFLNREGISLPAPDAEKLKSFYNAEQANFVTVEQMIPATRNSETHALHVKRVLDHVDMLGISSKRFKVVLDSVNGAGCTVTATLLNRLGCQLIHLNATPDGKFPHEPEPIEKNLTQLAGEVRRQKATVGFAQDPDADRLAIVDENGRYIGEEYSLALCAKWIFSKKSGIAVTNLSTSRMLDDIAAASVIAGGGSPGSPPRPGSSPSRVIRTPVGEANVMQTIARENAVIGGEGNGGVIDPRIVGGRDSLVGMAYVLSLLAATGKTVSRLVAEIPRYEIVKTKFECRREDAERAVAAVKRAFANERIDTQDGIRIDWDDSWVHARPSNTEPIMRIIAEAPDRATAEARAAAVQKIVDAALRA